MEWNAKMYYVLILYYEEDKLSFGIWTNDNSPTQKKHLTIHLEHLILESFSEYVW